MRAEWKSELGNLSHEYFKWLGNLTYKDLVKLAKHILMTDAEDRIYAWPKVTIKQVLSVLESCHSSKD